MRTRVLVVDSYPLFRQGVCCALSNAEFEIVGEADCGRDALRLARELTPDVVLCDVRLPDASGVEVAHSLRAHQPDAAVVLLSADGDDEQLFAALRAGAAGVFPKDTAPEPLVDGLRRVARGETLIDERPIERPLIASRVLREFRHRADQDEAIEPLMVPLSAREIEILEHIARGHSNKLIARDLAISDQTVKNHITSILRKLAVNDRTHAVVFALRQGWIDVRDG